MPRWEVSHLKLWHFSPEKECAMKNASEKPINGDCVKQMLGEKKLQ